MVAKDNQLPLSFYIELKRRFNESKRSHRLKTRYGEASDWGKAESDKVFGVIVPMIINVKKEISSYWAISDIEQVPKKYRYLWDTKYQ